MANKRENLLPKLLESDPRARKLFDNVGRLKGQESRRRTMERWRKVKCALWEFERRRKESIEAQRHRVIREHLASRSMPSDLVIVLPSRSAPTKCDMLFLHPRSQGGAA